MTGFKKIKIGSMNYSGIYGILMSLAKNAFLVMLILILISIIFGEFLFYNHMFLVNINDPDLISQPVKFNEGLYNSVLENKKSREDLFNSDPELNYPDPFQ